MQQIKTNFGFKSVRVGNTVVYTAKIRIKSTENILRHKLQNHSEHLVLTERVSPKNYACYTIISFETTNCSLNQLLIEAINKMLCEIMHKRIDAKYLRVRDYEVLINNLEELPF